MSTTAVSPRALRVVGFWDSTNGKKVVMAITGAIMFLFVIGHLAGNLQIYEGRDKFNGYAHFLRTIGEVLWTVRVILIASVILHITATIQLAHRKKAARPVGYSRKKAIASSYASRTMYCRIYPSGIAVHRRRRLSQRNCRLQRVVGLRLVYLLDGLARPAPASRHLEHVPVRGIQPSAAHADSEVSGAGHRHSDCSRIYFNSD